jgi:hypothetical protein
MELLESPYILSKQITGLRKTQEERHSDIMFCKRLTSAVSTYKNSCSESTQCSKIETRSHKIEVSISVSVCHRKFMISFKKTRGYLELGSYCLTSLLTTVNVWLIYKQLLATTRKYWSMFSKFFLVWYFVYSFVKPGSCQKWGLLFQKINSKPKTREVMILRLFKDNI